MPSLRPRKNMDLRILTIMAWISRPGDTLERTCQAVRIAQSVDIDLCRDISMVQHAPAGFWQGRTLSVAVTVHP